MRKPRVLTPEQQLIEAKYQYPCTVTTYKNGVPTSSRVVTHNIEATKELRELYPSIFQFVNTFK